LKKNFDNTQTYRQTASHLAQLTASSSTANDGLPHYRTNHWTWKI